jgi:replicative DNA helicase
MKYRGQPSLSVIREKFPHYDLPLVSDSLEYVLDRFIVNLKRARAEQSLYDLAEAINDPDQAPKIDELFSDEARRLSQLLPGARIERLSDMKKRIEEYREMAAAGGPVGIQMGIPTFDDDTLGIQRHEYVSVVGWQGTGKSTLTQWILLNAYNQGLTPMYISLEMEARALFRKWDTMLTNMSYRSLKSGELTEEEIERWEQTAERVANSQNDVLVGDDVRSCTVDKVYAEMVKHEPDIVAIDYISLMDVQKSKSDQLWEKMTYLTNNLKQCARTLKTPVIGVAQTNINSVDTGAQLQNIAYSRSIGQDSDIVLGLHCDDEMRKNRRMQVKLLKNRDGRLSTADLKWDMENMRFRPWQPTDDFTSIGGEK